MGDRGPDRPAGLIGASDRLEFRRFQCYGRGVAIWTREAEAARRSKRKQAASISRSAESSTAAASGAAARILELQRTAGNQAVVQALSSSRGRGSPVVQALDWEDAVDFLQWTNPLTVGSKALRHFTGVELNIWSAAEQVVRLSATKISIPADFVTKLKAYAAYNTADGAILKNALAQDPSFYRGGVLLGGNKDALAITFGNSIFFGKDPDAETYIHEMVHINQYNKLGREAFLVSYFGLSLATIIKRALQGKPMEAMRSSPHEEQAYQLEARFKTWLAANP
jgi:hypothetical protein